MKGLSVFVPPVQQGVLFLSFSISKHKEKIKVAGINKQKQKNLNFLETFLKD